VLFVIPSQRRTRAVAVARAEAGVEKIQRFQCASGTSSGDVTVVAMDFWDFSHTFSQVRVVAGEEKDGIVFKTDDDKAIGECLLFTLCVIAFKR
jgi:uncharacterized protein involved in type VI secretion and phage assembly